jgi:hypothetical protein
LEYERYEGRKGRNRMMILKIFIMSGMMASADEVVISTQDNIVLISSER